MKIWRDHSLSIVMGSIGIALTVFAFTFDAGNWFDLFLSLGTGALTVVLMFAFAGPFRERNKPED